MGRIRYRCTTETGGALDIRGRAVPCRKGGGPRDSLEVVWMLVEKAQEVKLCELMRSQIKLE